MKTEKPEGDEFADTQELPALKKEADCESLYEGPRSKYRMLRCERTDPGHQGHRAFLDNEVVNWTDELAM